MKYHSVVFALMIAAALFFSFAEQVQSTPINDREAALHGGNNAEEVILDASGAAFNLLSIDVERLFGPDVWKITSSSGAMLNLSSVGRIDFGALGSGWQNITEIGILSAVIPLTTFGTHAIDFDNITVEILSLSTTVVMDFGVGPTITPNNYVEDGLTLAAVISGSGINHFDIGNFNDEDVPEPTTLLLLGLGLAGLGFARKRLH